MENKWQQKKRTDGIGRSFLSLFVHSEVPGDGSVRCFGFDRFSVGTHEDARHHAERSESWQRRRRRQLQSKKKTVRVIDAEIANLERRNPIGRLRRNFCRPTRNPLRI